MNRRALSARGVEREYGIARERIGSAIREGELPASRLGARRYVVLRPDLEDWIRRHAVRPTSGDEDLVARRLEREEARPGP